MPRLTAVIHPYHGRLPVLTERCPACGAEEGTTCYFLCERSPAYYSAEQERADDLAFDASVASMGWQAYDSFQHRAAGLPCPYDGDIPF